jgi:hypothetical protein
VQAKDLAHRSDRCKILPKCYENFSRVLELSARIGEVCKIDHSSTQDKAGCCVGGNFSLIRKYCSHQWQAGTFAFLYCIMHGDIELRAAGVAEIHYDIAALIILSAQDRQVPTQYET